MNEDVERMREKLSGHYLKAMFPMAKGQSSWVAATIKKPKQYWQVFKGKQRKSSLKMLKKAAKHGPLQNVEVMVILKNQRVTKKMAKGAWRRLVRKMKKEPHTAARVFKFYSQWRFATPEMKERYREGQNKRERRFSFPILPPPKQPIAYLSHAWTVVDAFAEMTTKLANISSAFLAATEALPEVADTATEDPV